MAKYHVNPSSGAVSRCFALAKSCPFGGRLEHYDTADDALRAFEKVMTGQTWTVVNPTMSENKKDIRPNQYFGMTISPEEEAELLLLEGEAFRAKLAEYRARTRAQFPGVDQRLTGTVSELQRAVRAGRAERDESGE